MANLNAFISETLRLHPPVPSSGLRDTPSEGIVIGDQRIPGGTTVLTPNYSLGRRQFNFVALLILPKADLIGSGELL